MGVSIAEDPKQPTTTDRHPRLKDFKDFEENVLSISSTYEACLNFALILSRILKWCCGAIISYSSLVDG